MIDLSAKRVFPDHFFVHWSTIRRPKGVPILCAAKTIMLHSCDVKTAKTRRQLWWRKQKSRREGEHIAWPEGQMMSATRIIYINRAFIYTTFQRMWLYGQNGCVSIVDIEKILLFNVRVVGLMLRPASKTPVRNTYHQSNQRKITNEFS